jgi:hypothetical protein
MRNANAIDPNPKRIGRFFLILCCVCVVALALNIIGHLGWLHVHLPGINGFDARWKWALGAAVFFALAWYMERLSARRRG